MQNQEQPFCSYSEEYYVKAFTKYFKCEATDFEIAPVNTNGPFLIKYGWQLYEVSSELNLHNCLIRCMTELKFSIEVPPEIIAKIAEDVRYTQEFLRNMVADKNMNKQHLVRLTNIIEECVNLKSIRSGNSFWETLKKENIFLYGDAVLSAAKTWSSVKMTKEWVDLLKTKGNIPYTKFNNTIFDSVRLVEEDENSPVFFVKSSDPARWPLS